MRVILGLGNPGSPYQFNRHNVGFMFLDFLAESYNLSFKASKHDFYFAGGNLRQSEFLLVKPSTYMNNSGIAAKQALDHYHVDVKDLLVVYDDLNFETAKFRIRASGGEGGHNGISSIIYHLNSNEFPRVKIGIGADFEKGKMAEYVLSDFKEEETLLLNQSFKDCRVLTEDFISGGLSAMLDTNSRISRSITKQNLDNKDKEN